MIHRIIKDYFGFSLGLIVFFFILFIIPENAMPPAAQRMAAIALLMAVWWITEAIPIPATALLPIVLFPLLEIMKTGEVTVNYGHHLVFLFLGGFIIALTIEKWNLHKRLALEIINIIGTNPKFIIPAKTAVGEKRKPLQDWSCTAKIPWGILILFGGGFALASGFQSSGLTIWLGEQLSAFGFLPLILIIVLVCAIMTLTTEFASNTAMATTLLPIVAGLAIALGVNPMLLMIPATISSSTAFMLPVATPPNAIVFGSGYIQIKDMVRIGIFMNIIGLILIVCLLYLGAGSIFGIDWQTMPDWAK